MRELHDTVAHALVAINVRAGVAAHLAGDNDPDGAFADIMAVSSEALDELRATLGALRDPAPLDPSLPGLTPAALERLLERPRATGLLVDGAVELDGHAVPLPVQQAAYRIVQEALTNVMRHSSATRAHVSVVAHERVLTIDVTDDGATPAAVAPGHGLRGMTERAGSLGSDVTAGPGPDGGWSVHAALPLT